MPKASKPEKLKNLAFDYDLKYKELDLRANPHLYRIGKGEQGVLMVEPYKSEIVKHWRFATPDLARESSSKLFSMYEDYKSASDFPGMDMTRKFVQMGVTRSRRYANHKGGRKYDPDGGVDEKGKRKVLPKSEEDPVKADSARIFGEVLKRIKEDPGYVKMTEEWREKEQEWNREAEAPAEQEGGETSRAKRPRRGRGSS